MITQIDPRTALVLIDLQKGIVNLPLIRPAQQILEKCAELIAAFRFKKLPLIIVNVDPFGTNWTQVRVEQPSAPRGEKQVIQARTLTEAADFFGIVPEVQTEPNDIFITKTIWGAFYQTTLHEQLRSRNITGIVIAGIATSIGVEGTARQASQIGYNISYATDAMTDFYHSAHEHSLTRIFPKIGETGDKNSIIEKVHEIEV